MVHPQIADVAERVGDIHGEVAVLLQQRHHVGDRRLPPIDLARLQCGGGGGGVRNDLPFDPIEIHPLAAGQPVGFFPARDVAREFLEHRGCARHPLVLAEGERAGADILADLLERIGRGDALRHDEGAGRAALAERVEQFCERLFQSQPERPVVHRFHRVQPGLDHLTHVVAHHPAREAGDAVAGADRLVVVEFQAGAQFEGPDEAVGRHIRALAHLRLRHEVAVHPVERVVEQHRGVAHHVERGPDRVQVGQIGLRNETQHLGIGCQRQPWRSQTTRRRERTRGSLQESPTIHRLLQPPSPRLCLRAGPSPGAS